MLPLARRIGNVERFERLVDIRNGALFAEGRKFQCWYHIIHNNAGTLRHCFSGDGLDATASGPSHLPLYADRLLGTKLDGSWTNLTTVGSGTGFTNTGGAGILDTNVNRIVYNHPPLPNGSAIVGIACPSLNVVTFYSGNANRPYPATWLPVVNINGTSRPRLTTAFTIGGTNSQFTVSTGNIPSGKYLITRVVAFL